MLKVELLVLLPLVSLGGSAGAFALGVCWCLLVVIGCLLVVIGRPKREEKPKGGQKCGKLDFCPYNVKTCTKTCTKTTKNNKG